MEVATERDDPRVGVVEDGEHPFAFGGEPVPRRIGLRVGGEPSGPDTERYRQHGADPAEPSGVGGVHPTVEPVHLLVAERRAVGVALPGEGDPDRSTLGDEQVDWFDSRVNAADTRWLGWVSAVLTVPFRIGAGRFAAHPKADSTWDGFPAERERVFSILHDADPGVVTLSGDLHSTVVGTQRLGCLLYTSPSPRD